MKITKWALIIVTFAIIIWLLFNLEIWAREWKDLFFYQDNWILFVALFVFSGCKNCFMGTSNPTQSNEIKNYI